MAAEHSDVSAADVAAVEGAAEGSEQYAGDAERVVVVVAAEASHRSDCCKAAEVAFDHGAGIRYADASESVRQHVAH